MTAAASKRNRIIARVVAEAKRKKKEGEEEKDVVASREEGVAQVLKALEWDRFGISRRPCQGPGRLIWDRAQELLFIKNEHIVALSQRSVRGILMTGTPSRILLLVISCPW